MTEVPGVREELGQAAEWLREQVRALTLELTGDPDVDVPAPWFAIRSRDDPRQYGYDLYVHAPLPPGGDPAAQAEATLVAAGWNVRVSAERPGAPTNIFASQNDFGMMLLIADALTLSARTPTTAPPEPGSADCPRCGLPLREFRLSKRYDLWWTCDSCRWLGRQLHEGDPFLPMHRLSGDEADCVFCGEDQTNAASDPWHDDGQPLDWVVCLSCGRSNQRRVTAPSD